MMLEETYHITFNNLMTKSIHYELSAYEQTAYNQLAILIARVARLNELEVNRLIESYQDGEGNNQTEGDGPPQDPEVEKYRDDDSPP